MQSPRPLHLQPRKLGALIALPFVAFVALGLLVSFPALVTAFAAYNHGVVGIVATAIFALLAIAATIGCLRSLMFEGPALVIDESGVQDRRRKGLTIRWSDMRSIVLGGSDTDALVIRLRDTQANHALRSALKRVFEGGDIVIGLGTMKYDARVLKQTIAGYMGTRSMSGSK